MYNENRTTDIPAMVIRRNIITAQAARITRTTAHRHASLRNSIHLRKRQYLLSAWVHCLELQPVQHSAYLLI